MRSRAVLIVAFSCGLGAFACGKTMPWSAYNQMLTDDQRTAGLPDIDVGTRLVLDASLGSCTTSIADSLPALLSGRSGSFAGSDWLTQPRVVDVVQALVADVTPVSLAVLVSDGAGSRWLLLEPVVGGVETATEAKVVAVAEADGDADADVEPVSAPCIVRLENAADGDAVGALAEVYRAVGQGVAFTPWAPHCSGLYASGPRAADALLDEASGDWRVAGVRLGGASPGTAQQAGRTPWVVLNDGEVRVRMDSFQSCFSVGASDASAKRGVQRLLRLPSGGCAADDDGDHMRCRFPVGVWQGSVEPDAISLVAGQQNLGTLHLQGGQLVDGQRYARGVVSIRLEAPRNGWEERFSELLQQEIESWSRELGGDVRLVVGDVPDAVARLVVDVQDIRVSGLREATETVGARYVVRKEQRANPRRAELQQEVLQAQQELNAAQANSNAAAANSSAGCEAASAGVGKVVDKIPGGGLFGSIMRGAAKVASSAGCEAMTAPDGGPLAAAHAALEEKKAALQAEPVLIDVPIEDTWPYTRVTFAREAEATLRVTRIDPDGERERKELPLRVVWQDYRDVADSAHNIKGHEPGSELLDEPGAVVGKLTEQWKNILRPTILVALREAENKLASEALAAAGREVASPENAPLELLAFASAGARLGKTVATGASALAGDGASVRVPFDASKLATSSCLLVAAFSDDVSASLRLRTEDARWLDDRGGPAAVLEYCPPKSERPVPLRLEGEGREAKWAVFATQRP